MKNIELTETEKSLLKEEIYYSNLHIKKQFISMSLYIFLGIVGAGILIYLKYGFSINIILFLLVLFLLIFTPILITGSTARKRIKNLKKDLESGLKIIGRDKVESINFFNRAVKLSNGIKVFEPEGKYKTFNKGDLINFKVSLSTEFIFECNKE